MAYGSWRVVPVLRRADMEALNIGAGNLLVVSIVWWSVEGNFCLGGCLTNSVCGWSVDWYLVKYLVSACSRVAIEVRTDILGLDLMR